MTQVTPCNRENGLLEDTDGFLLCDEEWDMTPLIPPYASLHHTNHDHNVVDYGSSHYILTKEDVKHLFDTYLSKEMKYMTGSGYVKFLQSNGFVSDRRLKAINWFIHVCSLSYQIGLVLSIDVDDQVF